MRTAVRRSIPIHNRVNNRIQKKNVFYFFQSESKPFIRPMISIISRLEISNLSLSIFQGANCQCTVWKLYENLHLNEKRYFSFGIK